jgi:hypothetical protein
VTYEKPELIAIANAVTAVQNTKKDGAPGDSLTRTAPAYEADE